MIGETIALSDEFTEYKRLYSGTVKRYDCKLLERNGNDEAVLLFRTEREFEFLGKTIDTEAICFGYFWEGRSYNVYHWKDELSKTILIYFNVSRDTKIGVDRVDWLDLIVDLAIIDGKLLVLDEDEVPGDMKESDRRIIEATKKEITSNYGNLNNGIEARSEELWKQLGVFGRPPP